MNENKFDTKCQALEGLLEAYRSAACKETSCFSITPLLVAGQSLTPEQEEVVKKLDRAIDECEPLADDMMFYRGCAEGDIVPGRPYPAFLSVSLDILEASRHSRGSLVRIRYPEGAKALRISPGTPRRAALERAEYLLPRGLYFDDAWWNPDDSEELMLGLAERRILSVQGFAVLSRHNDPEISFQH